VYKPLVHRQPAVTRTGKRWSDEAEEALKDWFESTLWEVFTAANKEDIDGLTDCITDYINFCTHKDCTVLLKQQTMDLCGNKDPPQGEEEGLLIWKQGQAGDCAEGALEEDQGGGGISTGRGWRLSCSRMTSAGPGRASRRCLGIQGANQQSVGDQRLVNDLNLFFNRFDQPSPHTQQSAPLNTRHTQHSMVSQPTPLQQPNTTLITGSTEN